MWLLQVPHNAEDPGTFRPGKSIFFLLHSPLTNFRRNGQGPVSDTVSSFTFYIHVLKHDRNTSNRLADVAYMRLQCAASCSNSNMSASMMEWDNLPKNKKICIFPACSGIYHQDCFGVCCLVLEISAFSLDYTIVLWCSKHQKKLLNATQRNPKTLLRTVVCRSSFCIATRKQACADLQIRV